MMWCDKIREIQQVFCLEKKYKKLNDVKLLFVIKNIINTFIIYFICFYI